MLVQGEEGMTFDDTLDEIKSAIAKYEGKCMNKTALLYLLHDLLEELKKANGKG
jgi:hypothetical protein